MDSSLSFVKQIGHIERLLILSSADIPFSLGATAAEFVTELTVAPVALRVSAVLLHYFSGITKNFS